MANGQEKQPGNTELLITLEILQYNEDIIARIEYQVKKML